MIEVQHLTKRYGRVTAVDDVSFRVERGEILGFLGPNGAGKTTTLEIVAGLRRASSGRVGVLGLDPAVDRAALAPRPCCGRAPPTGWPVASPSRRPPRPAPSPPPCRRRPAHRPPRWLASCRDHLRPTTTP